MKTPIAVLHLEDNDFDAELVRKHLLTSALELSIDRVGNGSAFESRLVNRRYDLILVDFRVPGFDGFEALQLTAQHQPDVPVLFVSGALGEELAVEVLRRGATDFILKDNMTRLVPAVERALVEARDRIERRRAEERLRIALAAGRMGTWTLDLRTNYMECSAACKTNYGRAAHEPFTYEDLDGSLHPDDHENWRATVAEAIGRAGDFAIDYRTRWPDDSIHWVHVRGACSTVGGRVVGLSGVSIDITASKAAEGRLRESEANLEWALAATSRLHGLSARLLSATDLTTALGEVLDSAIHTCGADYGNIQLLNPRVKALEIVAQRGFRSDFLDYFRLVRVDDGSACARAMSSGEQIVIEDVALDPSCQAHLAIAAGAGYRAVASTPLQAHDGTIVGMLSVHFRAPHRISERDAQMLELYARHAADMIERMRFVEALKDADRRKDEFLAVLAHELRNPLAPIYSGMQLMRRANGDGRVVEHARAMIERQTTQLVRLVDDLMDVSRISRGQIELRKERVELTTAVNAAIEASRPLIEQQGHTLTVSLPEAPVTLNADPVRLTQVFMNLLNNAAKYSNRGGRISLSAERQGTDIVVSIKDDGIGIPSDRLTDIFEMFSQVDRSMEKSHGGLGIGLSLVKRLVEMHGGQVEARSGGAGAGAELVVRLPIHAAQAADPPSSGLEKPQPKSALRILVVDDNREAADSLSQLLDMMGNETRTAYDGEAAVATASEFKPAVVLLDIGMPKLNGLDTCRRMRQQPGGGEMALIALSGWGQEDDVRRSRDAGFDQHMVKPVDADQLMYTIAALGAAYRAA